MSCLTCKLLKNNQRQINKKSIVIWRFIDGKVGHEKQTASLILELEKSIRITVVDCHSSIAKIVRSFFLGIENSYGLPKPDIIIGAGHRTHLSMILARFKYGGQSVVIMKPTLPYSFFDFCLVPRHDNPPKHNNILLTEGPFISVIEPSPEKDSKKGLFLIGGPNKHLSWSDDGIISQIEEITKNEVNSNLNWSLTTSRRTPSSFLNKFSKLSLKGIRTFPFGCTEPGWIEKQLAKSGQTWVTQDSASMINEALSFGNNTGIIELPENSHKKTFRLKLNVKKFSRLDEYPVKSYSNWVKNKDWDQNLLNTFLSQKAIQTRDIVNKILSSCRSTTTNT